MLEREIRDAQVVYDGCLRTVQEQFVEPKRQEEMASNMCSKLDTIPDTPKNRRIWRQLQDELNAFVAKVREGQRTTNDAKRAVANALRFQPELREQLRHLQECKRRRLSS